MDNRRKKIIVFRCDASSEIGWGHMVRELAIAETLRKENKIIFAAIKDKKANLEIKNKGFETFFKKEKESEKDFFERIAKQLLPDIVVIDKKYEFSEKQISPLKGARIKVIMVDTLAKALRAADKVIFPNAHILLKDKAVSGFDYVVIRKDVLRAKKKRKKSFNKKSNIVLITGGTDPQGVMLKLISLLKNMNLNARITALPGKSFSFPEELKRLKKQLPRNFKILPYSLKEVIKADIAICTFGMSIYEMIYFGIPSISISHSKENAFWANVLARKYKVIEDVGYFREVSFEKIKKALDKLLNKKERQRIIDNTKGLIDAQGAQRIAKLICQ